MIPVEDRPDLLFIYGTLMAVAGHALGDRLRENGERVGAGSIQAKLYEVTEIDDQGENTYPGAVPSMYPQDRVHGEVWRMKTPLELYPVFDRYEACTPDWPEPWEFRFDRVPVSMEDGERIIAGCYVYAWDVSTATPIPSGRYQRHSPETR